jgi:hypothetical protein
VSFIDGLGYGKIMFKTDNENSIVDLWSAVRLRRTAPTIPENCPKGESQANGIAERAVQDVEGIMRTLKAALERRLGIRLKPSDAIMPWMIEHCSTLINRCRIGVDGMTSYERIKGKPNKKKFCEIGKVVLYMGVKSKKDKSKDKLNPKFELGIWLGVHSGSNEDIIGTDQGVLRACAIKMIPEDEQWSSEAVLKIKGVPWSTREEPDVDEDEAREAIDQGEAVEEDIPKTKRFYIRKEDVIKYGYTAACPGCTAIRNNRRAVSHNEKCREILLEKMQADADDEKRLAADADRMNEHFARKVEQEAKRSDEGVRDGEQEAKKRRKLEDESQIGEDGLPSGATSSSQQSSGAGLSLDKRLSEQPTRTLPQDVDPK